MSQPTITLCASHAPGDPFHPVVASAAARFATREEAERFAAEFRRGHRVRVAAEEPVAYLTVELQDTRGREKLASKVQRLRDFLYVAEKLGCTFEMRVDDADDYTSPEALRVGLGAL